MRHLARTVILALLAGCVVAALLPAPAVELQAAFHPLSWKYLLGATPLGQSVAGQIIAGAGQTLSLALAALLLALTLSLFFGGISFVLPRPVARAYGFLVDAWLAVPGIFIALSVGYFLPQSFWSVLAALVLSEFAALQKFFLQRLRDVQGTDYITMARVMGAGRRHTLLWHILPRLIREAGYMFYLSLPSVVLSLAGLEFLGVQTGANRLSLGMQIALYKDYILLYPHLSLAPVVCLLGMLALLHTLRGQFGAKQG